MKNLNLSLEAGGMKGLTRGGEISVVGGGEHAYVRIALIRDGKESGCAWLDNSAKLRRFLKAALRRCEVER